MKISISTFSNIRHFEPYMIPISTAVWDPKWFHDKTQPDGIYKDKRGIYNGLRYESLVPGLTCSHLCRGLPCAQEPSSCLFLQKYGAQLAMVNFDLMYQELEQLAYAIQAHEQFAHEPEIVLLVYETPDNPCSERQELIKWFSTHGQELKEVEF